MPHVSPAALPPLPAWKAVLYAAGAVACFHAAYLLPSGGLLIFGYVAFLTQLVRLTTPRFAFYAALLTGLLCVAPQSTFFYGIFGPFGIVLWVVLAFWTALYVALAHVIFRRLRWPVAAVFAATVWMGLEYFRSELYYLRFSWLNVGYALSGSPVTTIFRVLGTYGIGFVTAFLGACLLARAYKTAAVVALLVAAACTIVPVRRGPPLSVAGVQMEFPSTERLLANLGALVTRFPDAQLLVVSEYTCDGPIPGEVKA